MPLLGDEVKTWLEYHSYDPNERNTGDLDDQHCVTQESLRILRGWLNTGREPEDLEEVLKLNEKLERR